MTWLKNLWHDITSSAERGVLRLRAILSALVATGLQMALDPDAMSTWTTRRWVIFAGIVGLSALGGALKAGEKNPPPATP